MASHKSCAQGPYRSTSLLPIICTAPRARWCRAFGFPKAVPGGDLTLYELVTSDQPQLVTVKLAGQGWETTRNKLFVLGDPKEYPAIRMRMRRSRQNWRDMGHAHFAAPEISLIAIRGISRATAEKKTELTVRLAKYLIARDAASKEQLAILERFTTTELKSILPVHLLELANMTPQKRKLVLKGVEIFVEVSLPR